MHFMNLDGLATCKKCDLCKVRTNVVSGCGNVKSKIMFIGEAPGKNEDLQGVPFIGQAGSMLDQLLHASNLTRDDIYITNTVKCRPPKNRNPKQSEITKCCE